MSAKIDRLKILVLRECLKNEINDLERSIKAIDNYWLKNTEKKEGQLDADAQRRSEKQERLTACMLAYNQCWPNQRFIVKTLEDFYREASS